MVGISTKLQLDTGVMTTRSLRHTKCTLLHTRTPADRISTDNRRSKMQHAVTIQSDAQLFRHNVWAVRLMRAAVGFEARRSAAVALAFLSTSLVEARPNVPVSVVPAPAICRTAGSCIRWQLEGSAVVGISTKLQLDTGVITSQHSASMRTSLAPSPGIMCGQFG